MKNLKKVLALVVVFSMMLSTVAFAAFPDVDEDASYVDAVNTLAALGIIGGDDQGNFNPDNTITRAEFTKIVCEMQGLKAGNSKGATAFSDVPADHWASGYINNATQLGIINGMGDGTFAPSNPVTYEQAVKMIVVALGYEPMAAEKGGYPTGYLYVAQAYGLTKGIAVPAQTDAAKRSLIAELVYSALDLPMMEQVGFGSEKSFEVMDGSNDKDRNTLLSTKFDVVKLGGVVIGNPKTAITITLGKEDDECEGYILEDQIVLAYDNNYKSTNEDFELGKGEADTVEAYIGETDAADFFGQRVIAYLQEDGKDYVVLSIVPESGKNDTLEIAISDIVLRDCDEDKNVLAYFESETAKKSTKLDINPAVAIIWNGEYDEDLGLADVWANLETSAKATLVDWDANEEYDLIKVDEYTHYVVDEIDEDIYTLNMINGDSLTLDMEDDDLAITIKDADGNALDFSDIKEGDVIATIPSADDFADSDFIDITVLSGSAVEGVIKGVDKNSTPQKVTIGGEAYAVDPDAYKLNIDNCIGSEGMFYIGIDGQIVAFDGTKAAAGNYAIIIETEENSSGFDEGYQVKVLNKSGEAIIYNVAKKLKIKDVEGYADSFDVKANEKVDNLAGTAWADLDGEGIADILAAFDDKVAGDDYDEIVKRTVQIKVNSSNEITEIAPIDDEKVFGSTTADVEFNATTDKFPALGKVDASTVIFSINNNDIDKSKVITVDSLVDEATYTVVAFDKDNSVFTCAIVLNGGDSLAGTVNGLAVVKGVSETVTEDDDDAYAIDFYENGKDELKTIIVTEDTLVDAAYNSTYTVVEVKDGVETEKEIEPDAMSLAGDMGIGSLFLYSADADGYATVIASIANIEDDEFVPAAGMDFEKEPGRGSNKAKFYFGITTDKLTTDLAIYDIVRDAEDEIDVLGSTYKYRYNNASSRPRIEVGSYKGGNVKTAKDGEGNYIFAREVDSEIVDIISIDSRVELR